MATKGLGAIKDMIAKSTTNLKIDDGKSVVVRILTHPDDVMGVYEHTEQIGGNWNTITCLGKNDCPMCQAGKKASFKAYIVVADRSDSDKIKIFKASKNVIKDILGLVDEYGDITARDFKIARTGVKFDTKYQFFARDPKEFVLADGVEVPDVEELVAPMPKSAILAMLNGMGSVAEVAGNTGSEEEDDDLPF